MDVDASWLTSATAAIVALTILPRAARLDLQFLTIGTAMVVLLAFDGSVGEKYDAGGGPVLAIAKVADACSRDTEVEIRGTCNTCALKLAAGNALGISAGCPSPAKDRRPQR